MSGVIAAIPDRKISEETCKKYGVMVEYGRTGEIITHHYPYYHVDTGEQVAAKKRIVATKDMPWSGDRTGMGLFGQQTCKGRGKYITITEGEVDTLAVSEMFDRKWDVVSLPDGAQSARRAIQEHLEFLEGYDNIVLCFDNDNAGDKALDEVKDLFSPGKTKICTLPLKDAGEMLEAGRIRDFVRCFWDAKTYTPVGVVMPSDTYEAVLKYRDTPSIPYPWSGLDDMLQGIRTKEVVVVAAETGIGKSQSMREIQAHILETTEDRVGCLMLEESIAKSVLGWMSFYAGRPLHKELNQIPDEELQKYWKLATEGDRYVLLEHSGWGHDFEMLKARIRYMAKALDCRYIILDHLHFVLSSMQGATGDWSGIDELVTQLVSLAIDCDIAILLVCHTSGERRLRGSQGISKLADAVIFLEREKHHEDPVIANTTKVIVDKNRWGGEVGTATYLAYSPETGRMTETSAPIEANDYDF